MKRKAVKKKKKGAMKKRKACEKKISTKISKVQ
jgi:hypothetical protein